MTGKQVMVVEDDEFQRNVLLAILRQTSSIETACGAGSVETALAEIGRTEFDLIFLDLGLPGRDGLDLLRALSDAGFSGGVAVLSAMDAAIIDSAATIARMSGIRLMGAVSKPITTETICMLIDQLDQAGRDATASSAARRELSEQEIRAALEEQRVIAYFQPKVALESGRITGHEVLARLRDQDGSVIGPESFIAVAERSGQIDALTQLLTEQALAAQRDWLDAGENYSISINLSLRQQSLPAFLQLLDHGIDRYGVPADRVVVEVTESAVMANVAESMEILTRIRMHGFGLSIDDFGTGFSSLEQLRRLPFNELKIDRSFVSGACKDGRRRAILESCIEMAARLQLHVVVEGVETPEEYRLMQDLGCEFAQGFFICKPLPARELETQAVLWQRLRGVLRPN